MRDPLSSSQRQRLQAALAAMPARQREIFLAVRHGSASYAALATRFAIDPLIVERELAAALLALSDALDRPRLTWRRLVLRWLRRHLG